jgi:ATP-dependent DNA helicase UvrD/PcrA
MTRAKDNLSLVMPQRFSTHGQNPQGDAPTPSGEGTWTAATVARKPHG